MNVVLVDTNVLIDLIAEESPWADWSGRQIAQVLNRGRAVINPVIYAEVSVGLPTQSAMDRKFPRDLYVREAVPFEAAFLAGKVFREYRQRGGRKLAPLPDFFIGAHALVAGYTC
jgi:hypothetical protein